jgi:hypothetical protein
VTLNPLFLYQKDSPINSAMAMNVRISRPAKTAMQSGRGQTRSWLLEGVPDTVKTPENLMGWISAADTKGQIRLFFNTAEEAVAYATAKDWAYTLLSDQQRTFKSKSYAANFLQPTPQA